MIKKTLEQLSADVKLMYIKIMEITAKMNNYVLTAHIVTSDDLLSQQGTVSISASQPQDAHVNLTSTRLSPLHAARKLGKWSNQRLWKALRNNAHLSGTVRQLSYTACWNQKMMRRTCMICSKILLAKVVLCAYIALARD